MKPHLMRGWNFSGWSGDLQSGDNPLSFTIDSDTELTANFSEAEPSEYSLSVSAYPSRGGSVNPADSTYEEGATATVEADPNEGWTFTGWTGDVESTENPLDVRMNSDKTLTANFEQKEYELAVTADPSDGGSVEPADGTYKHGEEVTIEATASEGWEFTEWGGQINSLWRKPADDYRDLRYRADGEL
ncbi:MAG: InlB B-repeat-containing protein [Fodinibius sp.]|nr:InlB B-repeat-containing protein [Fodinibius sp.]